MRTICVLIENTIHNGNIIDSVYMSFPCFIKEKIVDNNYKEITITARQEDIPSIEKRLSAIV